MFTIRGLLFATLFVACITAVGQLGTLRLWDGQQGIEIFVAALLNLIAFWSILRWIHEVEQIRGDHQRTAVFFADATAFVMFACQLTMVGYLLDIGLPRG